VLRAGSRQRPECFALSGRLRDPARRRRAPKRRDYRALDDIAALCYIDVP